MSTEETILALEKEALAEWSGGNPQGFNMHMAEDGCYIDDIGATNRIEGLEAASAYLKSLEEMIPKHNYEIVNPKVQAYGDCAILSYWYHPSLEDGTPSTKWRASVVYNKLNGAWKMTHAHWTMLKEEQNQ